MVQSATPLQCCFRTGCTTYYSSPDHMEIDMHSIHTRICHLMSSLRRENDEIEFMSAQNAAALRRNRRENYLVSW